MKTSPGTGRHCGLQRLAGVILAAAAWVVAAQGSAGGADGPVPAAAFFAHPNVLKATLSPSGTRLAVATAQGAERVGLVVYDLRPPVKVTRAAQFADADIASFHWVNDERLLFTMVDLKTGSDEDSRTGPGLFAVNADGSGLRELIARRWFDAPTGPQLSWHVLNVHYRLLHVPSRGPGAANGEVIVGQREFHFPSNDLVHVRPMWLNVQTGRTRSLDAPIPTGTVDWLFDKAGEPRVAITRDDRHQAIQWRGPGDAVWTKLAEGDLRRLPFLPYHVDDGGQLLVTRLHGPDRLQVLARYDFRRRAVEPEPLVQLEGFDFEGAMIEGRGDAPPLGVHVKADGETTVWFDKRMQALQDKVDARLPGRVNRLSCGRCGEPDMVLLVRSWSDRDPGQLLLYRPDADHWQLVAPVMDGIDPARMAAVELRRIKARDGRDLPVWLTLPAGAKPGAPPPAIVLVHGGPWVRGGEWAWSAMEQFLASRGYLVISPEFRGSHGYGDLHYRAGWKQWGRAMQDDVADALSWARAQGLADPQRACIAGASYGGYAALMGLVRHPELYRCGVAWVGVSDLNLYVQGSVWVNDDVSALGRTVSLPELVGDPKTDAAALAEVSPVVQADRIRAPLLLAYGAGDRRVPLAHGERLREAMRRSGREPGWVVYPDEGHSWRLTATQVDFAGRVERFLATHLAPAAK